MPKSAYIVAMPEARTTSVVFASPHRVAIRLELPAIARSSTSARSAHPKMPRRSAFRLCHRLPAHRF